MKIAILGLGTVGYGVYDIIQSKDYLKDVVVKYVLDKNLELQKVVGENTLVTTDYNKILEDKEVELVVETMGAKNFSYDCIKKALLAGKSIVTANKEVIAEHIDELTSLKLAFIGSIKDDVLDTTELGFELIKFLKKNNLEDLKNRFPSVNFNLDDIEVYDQIGKARGFLLRGGDIDYDRLGKAMLVDFRSGRMGRISLDKVK